MSYSNPEFPHIINYRKLKSFKSKMRTGKFTPSLFRQLANEMDSQKTIENWIEKMDCLPLPRELQIKILEYDVNHRENFKSSLERIPAKAALIICNRVGDNWAAQAPFPSPIEYITSYIPDKECLFYALNTCKCCKRHTTNRPVFGEYPPYDTYNPYGSNCPCKCRLHMRNLSRSQFFETEGYEPLPPWAQIDG